MGKPENAVESYLRKRAQEHGFRVFKFTSPGIAGVPDRVLIGHSITIFVEAKRPNEIPRKLQHVTFEQMRAAGAHVYVVDTKPLVDAFFAALSNYVDGRSGLFRYEFYANGPDVQAAMSEFIEDKDDYQT